MKVFFQTLLAVIIAFFLLAGGTLALIIGSLAALAPASPVVPKNAVLVLDLNRSIPDSTQDVAPGSLLQKTFGSDEADEIPLRCIIKALETAAKDDKICALYLAGNIQSARFASGPAALKELREAIQAFKVSSRKPVIAYNSHYSKRDLYLAGGATTVYLDPFGALDVSGLTSEVTFFAGAFKKYGVDVKVTRVGKYKSAVEAFILEKMSDASKEQTKTLLNDIWEDWKNTVAGDRKLSADLLQKLADEKGVLLAKEALDHKLIDKLANYDEVLDELKKMTGKSLKAKEFTQIDLETYIKYVGYGTKGQNRVAIAYAEGEIVDGDGKNGQVGGQKLSRDLRELRLDNSVKAVVLRVNSPGGSASASELIAREVRMLRAAGKPVVVSMGHLAASGGYWISMNADKILAQPNTITGSIGVFGLQSSIKKLANDHGITWDGVQMAKLAPPTLSRPPSPEELARTQSIVDDIYGQFISKVAEGRKLDIKRVHDIAQGRIWSGKSAKELGLVDEMGNTQDAIKWAAKLAKIENNYQADPPELPRDPFEKLISLMSRKGKLHRTKDTPAESLKVQWLNCLDQLNALNDPNGIYMRMPMNLELR